MIGILTWNKKEQRENNNESANNHSTMTYIFSWIPAYAEIVKKLPGYRNKQQDLIQVLRDIGVNVNEDEDLPGNKIALSEIDPYTFLFFLGKPKNDWNKVKILRSLCALWSIDVAIYDTCGIPSANPLKLWMFPWKYARTQNEIDRLWNFFDKANNNTLTDSDFEDLRQIPGIEKTKITEALFLQNPDEYLCINSKVRPFLKSKGIDSDFDTFAQLKSLYQGIRRNIDLSFHEISFFSHIQAVYGENKQRFYRIGTKEGESGTSMLPDMLENDFISLGWSEIGDLNEHDPLTKGVIKLALQDNGYHKDSNSSASRKAGEILKFVKDIAPLDFVFAVEGGNVKAIGQVLSNHYAYDDAFAFPHIRCVKWLKKEINDLYLDEGLRTSVWEYENKDVLDKILNYMTVNNLFKLQQEVINKTRDMALNSILFGPPGTGKTYSTIEESLRIFGDDYIGMLRKEQKENFAKYQQSNRAFFITFHQNLSYEDFIEGIKPVEPQEDDEFLQYEIKDGLFMRACVESTYNYLESNFKQQGVLKGLIDFNDLYDTLYDRISNSNDPLRIKTKSEGSVNATVSARGNFTIRHDGSAKPYTVSRARLSKLFEKYPAPKEISNVTDSFRKVIGGCNSTAYWSVLNEIAELKEKSSNSNQQETNENTELSYEDKRIVVREYWNKREYIALDNDKSLPFVLIIDEINRGNVAQIFGELITLIEEDKRMGKVETIYSELPYSKDYFSVPPNLYILGTMNTADRSVEALDTALRRRFSFIPKLPLERELDITDDEIDLEKLLSAMNTRLKILKDQDHTIGHAWLWNVKDVKSLRKVFENKIIPLLQEYFYNDYEKLGLVLGEKFIDAEQIESNVFATFNKGTGLAAQYNQSWKYSIKDIGNFGVDEFRSIYENLPEAQLDEA